MVGVKPKGYKERQLRKLLGPEVCEILDHELGGAARATSAVRADVPSGAARTLRNAFDGRGAPAIRSFGRRP